MAYSYLYIIPAELWSCYIDTGYLTHVLDEYGVPSASQGFKYRGMGREEIEVRLPNTSSYPIPFRTCALTPTVIDTLYRKRDTLLHLGTLLALCWLDKPHPPAVLNFLEGTHITDSLIKQALTHANYYSIVKRLRSTPRKRLRG